MRNTLILCICSVMLLVKGTSTYPAVASDESSEEEIPPRNRLVSEVIDDMTVFADWLMEENSKVIKATLEDVKKKHEHDLTEYVTELDDYIDRANKYATKTGQEKFVDMFKMFESSTLMLEKYDIDKIIGDNASLAEIVAALYSHGQRGTQVKFAARFLRLVAGIEAKVKTFVEALTTAEKAEHSKLVAWYDQISKENDNEKKIDMIPGFFKALN